MILRTSDCDLPQKEQRVMRDDLAMEGECFRSAQGVETRMEDVKRPYIVTAAICLTAAGVKEKARLRWGRA